MLFAVLPILLFANDYKQLTNIPTVYITTDGGASVEHDTYVGGKITVVSSVDSECMTEAAVKIKGRGNSTWNMEKKPYSIMLSEPQHFLSMNANAEKWDFIADYADKSLMRGAVAFHLGKWMGMEFTPDERFADVYINGTYMGNYHVTDHMEAAADRVPVAVENPTQTEAAECGYFLEIDGWASSEPQNFTTSKSMPITIHYPEKITTKQNTYIKKFIQDFENRLFSSNFTDAQEGWRAMADTASLINWYVAIELVGNPDAFWSTFIYKKPNDEHLYFGPMWDYDIAFNNDNRLGEATRKTMRDNAHNPKTWIQQLWKDPWFRHAANRKFQEILSKGVEKELDDYIELKRTEISASAQKNFEKWNNISERVYREQKLFSTWKENVDYLKTYLSQRIFFLSQDFETEDDGQGGQQQEEEIKSNWLYNIKCKTSGNFVDLLDQDTAVKAKIVSWEAVPARNTQLWEFRKHNNGYYQILNYAAKKAIQDYQNGKTVLMLAAPDSTAEQQMWEMYDAGEGWYMIINKASGYGFNNEGGSSANGTQVIAYNADKSSSSSNRRWALIPVKEVPKEIIDDALDYNRMNNISYDAATNKLLLRNGEHSIVSIFTVSGRCVFTTTANTDCVQLPDLHPGMYLINISDHSRNNTLKIIYN